MNKNNCIFCKIVEGKIPCEKIYEDHLIFAFLDVNPISKGHLLLIPKEHSDNFLEMNPKTLKYLFEKTQFISKVLMKSLDADGFNIGINTFSAAGQVVMHTHVHIIPRWKNDSLKSWPSNSYSEGEIRKLKDKIVKFL